MSIRYGQILHVAGGFVIDRLQTAGVSSLNINETRIYETGNFKSVQTIRDTPDLSFAAESLDVSTEVEALLTGVDPTTVTSGQEFDFGNAIPIDIASPYKTKFNNYTIDGGAALPYLTLSDVTYRFGVRANATQSFTLNGDSVLYMAGAPQTEKFTLVNNTLTYNFAHTANIPYVDGGHIKHAVGVMVCNPSTHLYKRLFYGTDYTDSTAAITLAVDWYDKGYTELHVVYGTQTSTTIPQSENADASVKPGAVRGRDVQVYLSSGSATTVLNLWDGVQSIEANRRVNLTAVEELGNHNYVSQEYDTVDVTGNIVVQPADVDNLLSKIFQVANVDSSQMAGATTSTPLELEMRILNPDDNTEVLKTIYVPDARIQVPGFQAQVNQNAQPTFNYSSDSGTLLTYNGARV